MEYDCVIQMSLKILDFCYLAATSLYNTKGTPQCCNTQVGKHCNTGHQHVPPTSLESASWKCNVRLKD